MLVIGPPVWQHFAGRCKQHPLQKSEWLFLISPLRVKLLKVSLPTFFSKKVGHPCSFSANALWQAGQTVLPYSCTEPGDTWPHRTQASAGRYLRSRMASPSVMISSGVSVVISKVAQFLGQHNASQTVDTANNSCRNHKDSSSIFLHSPKILHYIWHCWWSVTAGPTICSYYTRHW